MQKIPLHMLPPWQEHMAISVSYTMISTSTAKRGSIMRKPLKLGGDYTQKIPLYMLPPWQVYIIVSVSCTMISKNTTKRESIMRKLSE